MQVLLDTHVFLWWVNDDKRLVESARAMIADANNTLYLSAASTWEIAIKVKIGRLQFSQPLERFVANQLARNNMVALPIYIRHTLHTYTLPLLHRDPFDRMLISQCQLEKYILLTNDSMIQRYDVNFTW